MTSCLPTLHLERLLKEELADDERKATERHVEYCRACQQTLQILTDEISAADLAPFLITSSFIPQDPSSQELNDFFGELKRKVLVTDDHRLDRSCQSGPEPPRVAGYEIIEELGRGSVGVVYRARHCELNRIVAIKMLVAGQHLGAEATIRLRREARAIARLRHPNIVQVYHVADENGCPYISLELAEGGSLARWLGKGPISPPVAASVVATIAEAIAYAHDCGVIHRDLKPANVLLATRTQNSALSRTSAPATSDITDWELKISDFGLAKVSPVAGWAEDRMTLPGTILGTPAYIAPEQAVGDGREVGPAADIYSIGAILYELLTGRPPFVGSNPVQILLDVAHKEPLSPARLAPDLPRNLQTICLKCLEKDPKKRYSSGKALAADLHRFLNHEPIKARRVGWLRRITARFKRHPARALFIAGNIVLAAILCCAGYQSVRDRSARRAMVEDELREITRLIAIGDWPAAETHLSRGEAWLDFTGSSEFHAVFAQKRTDLEQAKRDDRLVARLEAISLTHAAFAATTRQRPSENAERERRDVWADQSYEEAFTNRWNADFQDNPAATTAWVKASRARLLLLAALDEWAVCTTNPGRRSWILTVARGSDPDPWRDRARDRTIWNNQQAIGELARSASMATQPPRLLIRLSERLFAVGAQSVSFLRKVCEAHPSDFWTNLALGNALSRIDPVQAEHHYRLALAIRPDSPTIANNLGLAAFDRGRWTEAIEHFRRASQTDPSFAVATNNVGVALKHAGKWVEAEKNLRLALLLDPKSAICHFNIAGIEAGTGKHADAINSYQTAIELDPNFSMAHAELGVAILGRARLDQTSDAHWRCQNGKGDNRIILDAISSFTFNSPLHTYKQCFAFDPTWIRGSYNPKTSQPYDEGLDEAIHQYREAIRLDPALACAHGWLGHALLAVGRFREAAEATNRALELLGERDESRESLLTIRRHAERMALLNERPPSGVSSASRAENAVILLDRARVCMITRSFAAAVPLYAAAFTADPSLADDVAWLHRFHAARAAALAGWGVGEHKDPITAADRALLLAQARTWLAAELVARAETLESGQKDERTSVRRALGMWYIEPELVWLRKHDQGDGPLPALPRDHPTLWSDLDALFLRTLDQTSGPPMTPRERPRGRPERSSSNARNAGNTPSL